MEVCREKEYASDFRKYGHLQYMNQQRPGTMASRNKYAKALSLTLRRRIIIISFRQSIEERAVPILMDLITRARPNYTVLKRDITRMN